MTEETEQIKDDANTHRYWRDVKRKHTGRLVLEISARWGDDLRRRWADGKKQQLENVLGSFLLGIKKWIAHEKQCRLDTECEARQKQQAETVRQERKNRNDSTNVDLISKHVRTIGERAARFDATWTRWNRQLKITFSAPRIRHNSRNGSAGPNGMPTTWIPLHRPQIEKSTIRHRSIFPSTKWI